MQHEYGLGQDGWYDHTEFFEGPDWRRVYPDPIYELEQYRDGLHERGLEAKRKKPRRKEER